MRLECSTKKDDLEKLWGLTMHSVIWCEAFGGSTPIN